MHSQGLRTLVGAIAFAVGALAACGSPAPSSRVLAIRLPQLTTTDGGGPVVVPIAPLTGGQPELITAPMVADLHATVAGHYADRTGAQPLPHNGAYVDDPLSESRRYLVGHSTPAIFGPLLRLRDGDTVEDRWAGYGDGSGQNDHMSVYRVVRILAGWPAANGAPPLEPRASVQLQTCENPSGTSDRIVDLQFVGTT